MTNELTKSRNRPGSGACSPRHAPGARTRPGMFGPGALIRLHPLQACPALARRVGLGITFGAGGRIHRDRGAAARAAHHIGHGEVSIGYGVALWGANGPGRGNVPAFAPVHEKTGPAKEPRFVRAGSPALPRPQRQCFPAIRCRTVRSLGGCGRVGCGGGGTCVLAVIPGLYRPALGMACH